MSTAFRFAAFRFAGLFRWPWLVKDRVPPPIAGGNPLALCSARALPCMMTGAVRMAAQVIHAGTFSYRRVHSQPQSRHKEVDMSHMLTRTVACLGAFGIFGVVAFLLALSSPRADATSPGVPPAAQSISSQLASWTVQIKACPASVRGTCSNGYGVVVAPQRVVTSCGIFRGGPDITVTHGMNGVFPARLRYADHVSGLCLITVPELTLAAARIATVSPGAKWSKVFVEYTGDFLDHKIIAGSASYAGMSPGGSGLIETTVRAPQVVTALSGAGVYDRDSALIGVLERTATGSRLAAIPISMLARLRAFPVTSSPEPLSTTAWVNGANEKARKQDWSGLRLYAERWVRAQPQVSASWTALGEADFGLGRTDPAFFAFDQALKRDSKNPQALSFMGLEEIVLHQYAAAIASFQKALAVDPKAGRAWAGIYLAERAEGHDAKALSAIGKLRALNPEYAASVQRSSPLP